MADPSENDRELGSAVAVVADESRRSSQIAMATITTAATTPMIMSVVVSIAQAQATWSTVTSAPCMSFRMALDEPPGSIVTP